MDSISCKKQKKPTVHKLVCTFIKYFVSILILVGAFAMAFSLCFNADKIYAFFSIGLFCSLLATYYKVRIYLNPSYKPNCNCTSDIPLSTSETMMNGIFTVLDHKKGALLFNIPNSVYGILFYIFLIMINTYDVPFDHYHVTIVLISTSCIGCLYLLHVMIFQIKSICLLCVTIYAANYLTLYHLIA